MRKIVTAFLTATLALFFVACDKEADNSSATAEPIAFEILTTSVHLQVEEPHTEVFRNQNQWNEFWALHPECNSGCVFSPPYVDFDSSLVVGVFWGLESAGGIDYARRIGSVERIGERTTVELVEGPYPLFTVMSYAYIFLKFERAEGPVEFTGVVPQ